MRAFREEIESVINRYSMENGSHTPDFILAEYLISCLMSFDKAVISREKWYGRAEHTFTPSLILKKEPEQ